MGAAMSAESAVTVTYVEPCSVESDGIRKLGSYPMVVPPRKGETVVLMSEFRGDFARFNVLEVIHRMPEPGLPDTTVEVTVLVVPVHTTADIDRCLTSLTGSGQLGNRSHAKGSGKR